MTGDAARPGSAPAGRVALASSVRARARSFDTPDEKVVDVSWLNPAVGRV